MKIGRCWSVLLVSMALLLFVGPAQATVYTLADQNSSASVDTGSQSGMDSWIVDGVNNLYQQWFWYRIGNSGGESSIDTISTTPIVNFAGDYLNVDYVNSTISVDVKYTLTGTAPGNHRSDIAETVTVTNNGTGPMDLHFFQYSDFDLNGTPGGQQVTFLTLPNPNEVIQTGGGLEMNETTENPTPSEYQATNFAAILNSLNDSSPTTLNDTNTASGDATWAFEWDETVAAGDSFQISKDKRIAPLVPEPATILGFGTLLLIVGRKLQKKLSV